MNNHILLVMKWLNDKDSVTQDELISNKDAAYATAAATTAAYDAGYAAYAAYAAYAEGWVNKYFERTKENKQDYIDALKPKTDKLVYTQAMKDAGELPSAGMECLINFPDIDNGWYKCTINFMGEYTLIASCKGVSERFAHIEDVNIKPLTPPIDLIDGKAYQFDVRDKGGIVHGIYNDYDKKLHVGQDHYFDLLSATNIKLLEVK